MKARSLAALLLLSSFAPVSFAADKPDPADFTIKVHVVSSAWRTRYAKGFTIDMQVLETIIDNQPVELTGESIGVLAIADYSARLSKHGYLPKKLDTTYDIDRFYDLLLPDGKTRTYAVTRLGPAPSTNP